MERSDVVASVPQEIWDHIINLIDDNDNATLYACSCPGWLNASQSRLFSDPIPRYKPSAQFLQRMRRIYCILKESPHLRAFVSTLTTTTEYLDRFAMLHLPRVQDLHLVGITTRDSDYPHLPRAITLAAFPHLQGLHFHQFTLTPSQFFVLINSVHRLSRIGLHTVYWSENDASEEPESDPESIHDMPEGSDSQHVPTPDVFPSEFVPEPPSEPASESAPVNTSTLCLRALEVHHGAETWTLNRMMDWADSGRFVLAIEKLSLHAHFYDDWTYALYDILARSDELRSLEIIDYNSIATYLGPLDFSNLHSLQDLTCDVRLPTDIARSVLPHIVESIATLRSRSFHSLVISVRAPGSPLEDFLREMGTAFNKVVIDRLTELHLRYEKKREPLDVNLDDLTNELFGALKRRGVAVKLFTESYDQLLAPKQ